MWWCFWTFAQRCGFDFNKTVKCLAGCAIKQARITFYKMHEVLTFIYLSVGSLNDPMLCICMCFAGVLRLKLFFAFLPALDGFGVYPSLMQLPTVSRRTSRGTAHIIIGWRDLERFATNWAATIMLFVFRLTGLTTKVFISFRFISTTYDTSI